MSSIAKNAPIPRPLTDTDPKAAPLFELPKRVSFGTSKLTASRRHFASAQQTAALLDFSRPFHKEARRKRASEKMLRECSLDTLEPSRKESFPAVGCGSGQKHCHRVDHVLADRNLVLRPLGSQVALYHRASRSALTLSCCLLPLIRKRQRPFRRALGKMHRLSSRCLSRPGEQRAFCPQPTSSTSHWSTDGFEVLCPRPLLYCRGSWFPQAASLLSVYLAGCAPLFFLLEPLLLHSRGVRGPNKKLKETYSRKKTYQVTK